MIQLFMFNDNKYTKWYYAIIKRALQTSYARKKTPTKDIYTERHHIIPRALGGTDEDENIIRLTGREHFVCHLLLIKMTTDYKQTMMIMAINFMSTSNRYKVTSTIYEQIRKKFSIAISQHNKGKKLSLKHREKLSIASKGKKFTITHRENMGIVQRGKPKFAKRDIAILELLNEGQNYHDVAVAIDVSIKVVTNVYRKNKKGFYAPSLNVPKILSNT